MVSTVRIQIQHLQSTVCSRYSITPYGVRTPYSTLYCCSPSPSLEGRRSQVAICISFPLGRAASSQLGHGARHSGFLFWQLTRPVFWSTEAMYSVLCTVLSAEAPWPPVRATPRRSDAPTPLSPVRRSKIMLVAWKGKEGRYWGYYLDVMIDRTHPSPGEKCRQHELSKRVLSPGEQASKQASIVVDNAFRFVTPGRKNYYSGSIINITDLGECAWSLVNPVVAKWGLWDDCFNCRSWRCLAASEASRK